MRKNVFKNSAAVCGSTSLNHNHLGGCYPPRPTASVDNTLLDLLNSSYPTQPHSLIAN